MQGRARGVLRDNIRGRWPEDAFPRCAKGVNARWPLGSLFYEEDGPLAKKRGTFFDQRLYGTGGGYGKSQGVKSTDSVVRIKSYCMHKEGFVYFDHYGDKSRVFAKCISGGRPFDMVDIMLMTQS